MGSHSVTCHPTQAGVRFTDHLSTVSWVYNITKANLVDVEFGDCGVEHTIKVVKHRHDLHRSTFAGQRGERHNV